MLLDNALSFHFIDCDIMFLAKMKGYWSWWLCNWGYFWINMKFDLVVF